MQKLKQAVRKIISSDPFDLIDSGEPSHQDYSHAIHTYHALGPKRQAEITASFKTKMEKEHSSRYFIQMLLLCDFLSATAPDVIGSFPQNILQSFRKKSKGKANNREEKNALALNNFIFFYLQYLELKAWGSRETLNLADIAGSSQYCEQALKSMKLVLNYDFVMEYLLAHSGLKLTVSIAIESILRRTSEDLSFCIRFLDRYQHVILQEGKHSVLVNEIYEGVVYMSKNVEKLKYMGKKIKINKEIKFPTYSINKELNRTIEIAMLGKSVEKREVMRERQEKSKRVITEADEGDHMEITECEIFVNIEL